MITAKEIHKEVDIQYYQLEHLVKSGQVEAVRSGKGRDRKFPDNTIEKIKIILAMRAGTIRV